MWTLVLPLSLSCGPGASTVGGNEGSGSSTAASSSTTEQPRGCGDGIHEPGEVCYEHIETGHGHVSVYPISIARGGTLEDAMLIASFEDVGKDVALEIVQVRDLELVNITQPLWVTDGADLYSYRTVDLDGSGVPKLVGRSMTQYMIFSIVGDTLEQNETVDSHLHSGGAFLPGDIAGDSREEIFDFAGRLIRLTGGGVEELADLTLGACGILRAGHVADFNGDGRDDVLALGSLDDGGIYCADTENYDPVEHRATIVLGRDDPQEIMVSHEFGPGVVPLDVVTGDYNGDGMVDVAFAGPDGARVFLGRGDATFEDGLVLAPQVGNNELNLRHSGDIDGDGEDELVAILVGSLEDNDLVAIDGVVSEPTVLELEDHEYYPTTAAADLNNDGIVDFALHRGRTVNLSFLVSNP